MLGSPLWKYISAYEEYEFVYVNVQLSFLVIPPATIVMDVGTNFAGLSKHAIVHVCDILVLLPP